MNNLRLIKKYPNRRLYDTKISSYVTLDDIRQLVMDGEAFEVRDARSDKDLTRLMLLQIIMEREEGGQPMLGSNSLRQLIRLYGDPLQGLVGSYIEHAMGQFVEQQAALRKQFTGGGGSALARLAQIAERNLELWKSVQQGVLKGGLLGSAPTPRKPRGKTAKTSR